MNFLGKPIMKSHYDILEVTPNNETHEIKITATRKLARIDGEINRFIRDYKALVVETISSAISITTYIPCVLIQIIFEYTGEIPSKQFAELQTTRQLYKIAEEVIGDPEHRFSYDRFELDLPESKGKSRYSRVHKEGVLAWRQTMLADDNYYRSPFLSLNWEQDFSISRHGDYRFSQPIIAMIFQTFYSRDEDCRALIKPLAKHAYYPVSESKILPIHENIFYRHVSDNVRPAFAIKDPASILMFIQQIKSNAMFDSKKELCQKLLEIEQELYTNICTFELPTPYHIVSQEYSHREDLLTIAQKKTRTCRLELLNEKKNLSQGLLSFLNSSKKISLENDAAALYSLEKNIKNYLLTKDHSSEKSITSLINDLKKQNTKLEDNSKIKSLFSALETLEKEHLEKTIKEIGTLKKYIGKLFQDLNIPAALIEVIFEYMRHEFNPTQDAAPAIPRLGF